MSQTIHVTTGASPVAGPEAETTVAGRSARSAGKKKKLLAAGLVLALIGGGLAYRSFTTSNDAVASYKEHRVSKDEIAVTILSTGTVQPENRVEIKPPIAGRVEKVLADEGRYVRKGEVLAWMSSTERAALLDAASARGPEELKQWEEMYRPTPILAPINGRVIHRNVESGQTFAPTDAIFVMSDRLTVKAQVDETDIAQIKLRQKGVITLDAYPREKIPATVDQIAYEAKTVNNVTTYIVDVLPEKAPETMRSGMTANVSFEVESRKDALVVPAEALKMEKGRTTVLVAGKAPGPQYKDAVEKEIRTGINDGKKYELLSGLSEGDVILAPVFRLPADKGAAGGASPFSPMRPGMGRGGSGRGR